MASARREEYGWSSVVVRCGARWVQVTMARFWVFRPQYSETKLLKKGLARWQKFRSVGIHQPVAQPPQ